MRTVRTFFLLMVLGITAHASSLDTVHLQLKWKHQFQFAGYYAAIEQGYYKDAGLEVQLLEAEPGQDPVDAVLKGTAEFGVGSSDLVIRRAKGDPLVVLAAIFQHSALAIAAHPDTSLQSVHELLHHNSRSS